MILTEPLVCKKMCTKVRSINVADIHRVIFTETTLPGAYVIEPEKINDHRGYFARLWCKRELQQHGLKSDLAQLNAGFSRQKGTLRGLHFQKVPAAEVK